MSTNDLTAGAAMLRLDDAVRAAYNGLRAVGLDTTPARDAVIAQVAGIVEEAAHDRDDVPLPVADVDIDDDGGGGVKVP